MSTDIAKKHHAEIRTYLLVFGSLMVLTVATVTASYLHLPPALGLALGLAIATLKASLVGAFFMHLKGERMLIYGLLGLTLFFVIFLFAIPMTDMVAIKDTRVPYGHGVVAPPTDVPTSHH